MRNRPLIGPILLTLLTLGACTVRNDGWAPGAAEEVSVDLALGVGGDSATKASISDITEMNSEFRGMTGVRVVPFFTGLGNTVKTGDQAIGYARSMPDITGGPEDTEVYDGYEYHSGLLEQSHAHLYRGREFLLPATTTALLAYGRATDVEAASERAAKQRNGSLVEAGWEMAESILNTSDISFSPDAIYGDDIASVAGEMAGELSKVAKAFAKVKYYYSYQDHFVEDYAQLSWLEVLPADCSVLADAFMAFVSDTGYGPQLIPGAYVNLLWRLNTLSAVLATFDSDTMVTQHDMVIQHDGIDTYIYAGKELTKGYLYDALCEQLKSAVTACKKALADDYSEYPQSFGFPSGASFLLWNGAAFQAVPEALDGWIPATQYCYMPSLYYYVNTPISTSTSSFIYERYPGKTWPEIVYMHKSGKMITSSTRVIVLDKPLQFACGKLTATIQATVNPLRDRDGKNEFTLDAFSTDFPLTGLIIGGQYKQRYDFSPVVDEAEEQVYRESFMYDARFSGIHVNTRQSDPFYTLVLPTPLEQEVYFYLELRNDSGREFVGADGIIPAGSRFYLAGKIPFDPSEEERGKGVNRIFMQDRNTMLTYRITSLQNAYLCIPQMGNPGLLLGVQTKVNWFFSSSSYVVLG